ncbi:MAG: DUF6057 family protein [Dysgonomonas sp.]
MNKVDYKNVYKLNGYVSIFLFAIVAFLWLLIFNRYHLIITQEENQLFRTDYFYFQSYMQSPGGLTEYLGSFFTQFYYYPWLGALIISLVTSLVYLLLMKICKTNSILIVRFFIIPFTIPVLLIISYADFDTYYQLSHTLGICIVLFLAWLYLLFDGKIRYVSGITLYIFSYFITGGNALLFSAIVIITELFRKDRSFLYIGGLILFSISIPYLSHLFIYTVLLKSAYLAGTFFDTSLDSKTYNIAWTSIPIIYLISKCTTKKSWLEKTKPIKVLTPYYIIICASLFWIGKTYNNPDTDSIAHMVYESQHRNWKKVLEISERYRSDKNKTLHLYYTNMALSELGLLSSKMFHYNQIGTGLFIQWASAYISPWYNGELYYQMGIMSEAEHCAYEAMVNNDKEHSSKPLKRLVYTTMLRKDSAGFEKYIKLFENSPIYSNWAKQQREYYIKAQTDTTFQIPETPKPLEHQDFFMNYNIYGYNLMMPLQANKSNKKLFEYLTAYFLLLKDLESVIFMFEEYYSSISYDKMPRHYEEALLVYVSIFNNKKDLLNKYTISKETMDDFNEYVLLAEEATYSQGMEYLKKRHGNTYWYYFQFVNPMQQDQSTTVNRY